MRTAPAATSRHWAAILVLIPIAIMGTQRSLANAKLRIRLSGTDFPREFLEPSLDQNHATHQALRSR